MAVKDDKETETEDKLGEGEEEEVKAKPEADDDEPVEVSVRQPSRRERAAAEVKEQIRAATERAERAEQLAQQIREESSQNMLRIQQMMLERQAPQTQQREEPTDFAAQIAKQRKKANEALAAKDLDEYHDRMTRITDLQIKQAQANQPRPAPVQQQQQVMPKPAWVTAVEIEYPEVITHPQGVAIAAQFESMLPGQFGPEKLRTMLTKAREHLGIKPPPKVQQRRELLAGAGRSSGPVGGGGDDEDTVQVSKRDLDIARRMGVSPKDYARNLKAIQRGE